VSKITLLIPQQGFELIRDRIAEILADEFTNQVTLGLDPKFNPDIFVERLTPIAHKEMPIMIVSLGRVNFEGDTYEDTDGVNFFHLDVFTKEKSSTGQAASPKAQTSLHRIMGVALNILRSPHYKTLGFAPPFIIHTRSEGIEIQDPRDNQDSANTTMGRITFKVKAAEVSESIVPRVAEGYDTEVKLEETDKGYQYIIEN